MSDHELLQSYARDHAQPAFATLVERHINLVYSAARRQVQSSHLAEEIAQSVFIELARCAAKIPPAQPLPAWLYVVTRRVALNARRQESRRLARETTAAEIAAMKTPPESWPRIAELLDDAMDTLSDTERSAVVLRFFENQSLCEVGASLGISEDTAQKRVSRALDHLRTFLGRRGIAVTTVGLATDLSAHALQIAPAGLSAAISSSAALATGGALYAAAKTAEVIVMSSLQKTLLAATLALTLGTGLFEARVAANQRAELADIRQRTDALLATARTVRLETERSERALNGTRLASASSPAVPAALSPSDAATAAALQAWFQRIDRLKQTLAQRPELAVPELALLTEQSWFTLAQEARVDTEEEIRDALARLRRIAENGVANQVGPALRAYLAAHDDQLPPSAAELAPYFNPPVDTAVLARLAMVHTGKIADVPPREQGNNLVRLQAPVDADRDSIWNIGRSGFSTQAASIVAVREAQKAYAANHAGAKALSPADLAPYLKWPLSPTNLQKAINASPR